MYYRYVRKELQLATVTAFLTGFSFLLRFHYWPLYQNFGFYQGDIWYLFTFYGNAAARHFFYPIEYPVGYVIILKLAYLLSGLFGAFSYESFLLGNALLLIPIAALCTFFLYRIAPSKIWWFILSPSLFIYSTINYDLFAVVGCLAAIYFTFRGKHELAALCLSFGTVIKLFPVFLLPIFIFYWYNHKQSIIKLLVLFVGFFVVVNLPFFLTNTNTWLYPYLYQLNNPEKNDPTTLSYYLGNYRSAVMVTTLIISWLIGWKYFKKGFIDEKNFLSLLALTSVGIVLGNQVYVPQYFLWILPFFLAQPFLLTLLPLWWLFDLMNASTRFFYFRLKTDWIWQFDLMHQLTIIFYLFLYLLFFYSMIKRLYDKKS